MTGRKPVFLVGTGRCGSQLLFRMMAHHRSFRWFTRMEQRWPNSLFFRGVSNIVSRSFFYNILKQRVQPSEAYAQWRKADYGLLDPYRPLRAEDVTENKRKRVIALVDSKAGNKRLLAKFTGWSMIPYFLEIFPDAKFVHILRDGRAVVNSLLHVGFWEGWEGIHNWRWGMKDDYLEEISRYNDSFAAIAALQWKLVTKEIKDAGEYAGPQRFKEIKYEDLVADPTNTVKGIISFLGENNYPGFERALKKYKTKNMNYKWKSNLCEQEKKILNNTLEDTLKEYGYI